MSLCRRDGDLRLLIRARSLAYLRIRYFGHYLRIRCFGLPGGTRACPYLLAARSISTSLTRGTDEYRRDLVYPRFAA